MKKIRLGVNIDHVATVRNARGEIYPSPFKIPVLAYQVSGEYSLMKNGIKNNLINKEAILESLMCFKRAGASAIVSYFALEIAKNL